MHISFAQDLFTLNRFDSIAEDNFSNSNYTSAAEYSKKALYIAHQVLNDSLIIKQLRRLSYSYDYLGHYDLCQQYNFELLSAQKKVKNKEGEASALNDIGIIHYYEGEYKESLKYTFKALKIYEELKDTSGISMCYNNIANSQADDGNLDVGLDYYSLSLDLNKSLKDYESIVMCLGNIGETYYSMKNKVKSGDYYKDAVEIGLKNEIDIWYLLSPYLGLAQYYIDNNQLDSALYYVTKVYNHSVLNGYRAEISETYHMFSIIYETKGNHKESLEFYKKFKSLEDSIYYNKNNSKIAELNAKYEFVEKEIQLEKKNDQLEKEKENSIRNNWIIGVMVLFFIVAGVFSYFIYKENKERKWANYVLNETNGFLEQSFKDVKESIDYARLIQDAILPDILEIKKSFPESFVFYSPKDIVSGDFYWFDKTQDISFLAAVDCTGHGVPGAFMSMMASNLLNQVVLDDKIRHPTEAFRILDERLKYNLHQKTGSKTSEDGFDLSLIAHYHKENKIEFAGAKNNIYLISDGKLMIKKASRFSIGGGMVNKRFVGEDFYVKEGDCLYMFTDGFADQFGGEKDKKNNL